MAYDEKYGWRDVELIKHLCLYEGVEFDDPYEFEVSKWRRDWAIKGELKSAAVNMPQSDIDHLPGFLTNSTYVEYDMKKPVFMFEYKRWTQSTPIDEKFMSANNEMLRELCNHKDGQIPFFVAIYWPLMIGGTKTYKSIAFLLVPMNKAAYEKIKIPTRFTERKFFNFLAEMRGRKDEVTNEMLESFDDDTVFPLNDINKVLYWESKLKQLEEV